MAYPATPVGNQFPSTGFVTNIDFHSRVDVPLDALQAALYGAWTSFVPVLTSSGTAATLGTGGAGTGQYKIVGGNICHFDAAFTWGTTPTAGTGIYFMSLPVSWINNGLPPQFAAAYNVPATSTTGFTATPASATTLAFNRADASSSQLGAAFPSAPTSGRTLYVSGTYRCGT